MNPRMDPTGFQRAQKTLEMNDADLAKFLGIHARTVRRYKQDSGDTAIAVRDDIALLMNWLANDEKPNLRGLREAIDPAAMMLCEWYFKGTKPKVK